MLESTVTICCFQYEKNDGPFIDQESLETSLVEDMVNAFLLQLGDISVSSALPVWKPVKRVLERNLANGFKVILFDEPNRGIYEAKREFYRLRHELAATGVAVIANLCHMMGDWSAAAIVICNSVGDWQHWHSIVEEPRPWKWHGQGEEGTDKKEEY